MTNETPNEILRYPAHLDLKKWYYQLSIGQKERRFDDSFLISEFDQLMSEIGRLREALIASEVELTAIFGAYGETLGQDVCRNIVMISKKNQQALSNLSGEGQDA